MGLGELLMQNRKLRRGVVAALALSLAGALCAAAPAMAHTNYALLVGVTKYENLRGADLVGPANDVQLARDYLERSSPIRFEPQNVTLLATDVPDAAGEPTHADIQAAFARIATEAQPGDFVYVHLSGHGTQQPAIHPDTEADGLDEVFLPSDTNMWTDRKKGIPDALIDDEIGADLDAIRDKGAFVWIVFDSCHSGTATRAAPVGGDDVVERKIDPEQLGIPESAIEQAVAEAADHGQESQDQDPAKDRALALYAENAKPEGASSIARGGLVAFFAAQTVETTPEMKLPRGDKDSRRYGLFTYTLFSSIAQNPTVSYRQLGQEIMQAYSGDNRNRPTPLFEGDLDAPVFGTTKSDYIEQWPIKMDDATGMTVAAGALQRLEPGTKLAVLPSPGSTLDDAVGYLQVKSSDNLTSQVVPVAYDGKPALAAADMPKDGYARLAELSFRMQLVVSRPPAHPGYENEIAETDAILEAIAASTDVPVNLKLVGPDESADLKLAVLSEEDAAVMIADSGPGAVSATVDTRAALSEAPRLWFLPSTAEISLDPVRRPPSIGFAGSTPDGLKKEVSENLTRIFRATNLARLATASSYRPDEVKVGFSIQRKGVAGTEPLMAGKVPQVHPGDQMHLQASNDSADPVDVNVLYIGSDYSISHMYAQRLHNGSKIDIPLLEFTDTSFGIERMVVVLTSASAMTNVENLSFLEQQGVRQNTRGIDQPGGFAGLLADIGDAPATRGAARLGGRDSSSQGEVLIFPVETEPRT